MTTQQVLATLGVDTSKPITAKSATPAVDGWDLTVNGHPYHAWPGDTFPVGIALCKALEAADSSITIEPYVAPPPLTAAQQLAIQVSAAFAAGLAVTCTGTPALNGTYAVDDAAQARISRIETYIEKNGKFPGSAGTQLAMQDLQGGWHVFPSTALFTEFATAVADYVTELDLYAAGAAGASLPAANVTIA